MSPAGETPPRAFPRRHVPTLAVAAGRRLKRWRARGPRLGDYWPVSTLELPAHIPERACVPAVNFHAHLGRWLSNGGEWMEDRDRLLEMMSACNVESIVNLDGRWGEELEENLNRYDRACPGRFFTFCHVDWRLLDQPRGPSSWSNLLRGPWAPGRVGSKSGRTSA